jgi:hypothetical protein
VFGPSKTRPNSVATDRYTFDIGIYISIYGMIEACSCWLAASGAAVADQLDSTASW